MKSIGKRKSSMFRQVRNDRQKGDYNRLVYNPFSYYVGTYSIYIAYIAYIAYVVHMREEGFRWGLFHTYYKRWS
jgi:hypothetical protein